MAGEQIIVVEDERLVALDVKSHLERFGYVVPRTFSRAEDALAYIAAEPPSVVLMDIHLEGDLDGITAAEQIRRDFDVPVILLTAYADEATIERARSSRPFAYLIKPFNGRELRTSIVIALERHTLERAVRDRQLLLETVIENVGEAVFLCDSDGVLRYANGIAASMLDVEKEKLEGEHLSDVLRFESGVPLHEAVSTRGYQSLLSREGEPIPVDPRVAEVPGRNRVYVLQDVREHILHERELVQKEEQLSHARKMEAIGRLAGGIAHEFNNLLTVIMGYARLIADAAEEAEEAPDGGWFRRNAEGIINAATGSTSMIRQLLSFGRYEEQKPQRLELNSVVRGLDKILTRLMGEHVGVNFALCDNPTAVEVDPGRIEQSLLNLVINARDAMPRGGVLTIATRRVSLEERYTMVSGEAPPGEYLSLSVTDTGEGIDKSTLSRIFEPFFTTKERGSGTGLGLAAVYSTVEQSQGYLDVESEEAKGTTFTIYLPALEEKRGSDTEPPVYSIEPDGDSSGSGRVLMVIPDKDIRQMLSQLLSSHGYTVYETSNPGEALIVVEELSESFDLTVCDYATPLINGVRLLERVQASAPGKPSILLLDQSDHLDEETRRGLTGCISLKKPFAPQKILSLVRESMAHPHSDGTA